MSRENVWRSSRWENEKATCLGLLGEEIGLLLLLDHQLNNTIVIHSSAIFVYPAARCVDKDSS